jgi:uncharacterized cupin superfamily protein
VREVFNLLGDEWDGAWEQPGFTRRHVAIGGRLGAEKLGGTLYEVPPGESSCPYHFHLGLEEWLLVVGGRPTLRTPQGERELEPGEVVCFPEGESGAHKLENRSDESVRVLFLSTKQDPYVTYYPDSDKVGVRSQAERPTFRRGDEVDYFEGE